jgi:tRNA pseudouridine55 synthase
MARRRVHGQRVDGILLLDKPRGLSSNAALQQAKRLLDADKAGHTGTLDPMASGLLPLCFGEATKFAQGLLDADKAYVATLRLGITTTTGDAEGEVIEQCAVNLSEAQVQDALSPLVGCIQQQAPRHAALKYRGRNYYEYARAGIDIPRATREVRIDALRLVAWSPPEAVIEVRCGKGTYVRVLAESIGAALGCGAHLSALHRTACGDFDVVDAISIDALATLTPAARAARLLPVDAACATLPVCELDAVQAMALAHGREAQGPASATGCYRAYTRGRFLGVVDAEHGVLRARRLLASDGEQAKARSNPVES